MRTIEWQRTGGRTHRVTITEDVSVSRDYYLAMNAPLSCLGMQNAYGSQQWGALMQHQAVANSPLSGGGHQRAGYVCFGLFGNLLGGL